MIHQTYDEQICLWLENHRQQIVEDLKELVRIPSVHTQPFAPVEKEGLLIGRGVADNKNGVSAHQPDEKLDIDGLLQGIRILAHAALRCDALLHP